MDQFVFGASVAVLVVAAGACVVAWAGEAAERSRRIAIARRRSQARLVSLWSERAGSDV